MADDLLLLLISSPSGAGKTTLTRDLLEHFPGFTFSISHTTRKPRASELEGRDYYFVDHEQFSQLRDAHAFLEWAEVHGNCYGTSLSELERARRERKHGIVFDVDYQGARQIRAMCPSSVSVFILPPSLEELRRRLRSRASDDEASIERRYNNARSEIEHYGLFDYLLVNDDLERTKVRMRSIVEAELVRRPRMARVAEQLLSRR